MKLELTPGEMMDEWRLRRGVDLLRADAEIVRSDGMDFQRLLKAELDSWYAGLLDTAPPELLATENVARETGLADTGLSGARLLLPAECRRLLSVKLAHWNVAAVPLDYSEAATVLRRQANPFTAATEQSPVAVRTLTGILLFPATAASEVETAEAVTDRSGTVYRMDSRALETINPRQERLL